MSPRPDDSTEAASLEALRTENQALRVENQILKDEIARLKGLPPRPPAKPRRSSGMETATDPSRSKRRKGRRQTRGAKRDSDRVTREVIVTAEVPEGSRFKGYETLLVRDLALSAEVLRYRRERWVTPAGEPIVAPVPTGIVGGYGANLRRFCLGPACAGAGDHRAADGDPQRDWRGDLEAAGGAAPHRPTSTPLPRRISRSCGPGSRARPSSRWTTRAPAMRGATGVTTQIGGERFTAFRTGRSKSRQAFLSLLRAGHEDYVINDEALRYMRERQLAGPVIETLRTHPVQSFPNEAAWRAHLSALGIDTLSATPPAVTIATEGALWGAIRHHGLLSHTVIVSDDAGQFRLGTHALCWVHAERLVHQLVPATRGQAQAVETARQLIWWFYRDLKAWKTDPCPRRASALRARFDRIFTRRTGFVMLDRLLARLHRRKAELLRVLERPEIPLHTNASENDIRACVTKRKISGGTMSEAGRNARDVMLGLMKTCRKLGVSFFAYLGDRLGLNTAVQQSRRSHTWSVAPA